MIRQHSAYVVVCDKCGVWFDLQGEGYSVWDSYDQAKMSALEFGWVIDNFTCEMTCPDCQSRIPEQNSFGQVDWPLLLHATAADSDPMLTVQEEENDG